MNPLRITSTSRPVRNATTFSGAMLPTSQFAQNRLPERWRLCVRMQDVTLISSYGIENITAPTAVLAPSLKRGVANCDLHLPEGVSVTIQHPRGTVRLNLPARLAGSLRRTPTPSFATCISTK